MSNVLIGIIGVILFIGLAIAGALFLGPRFQASANTSKAAASIAQIAQVSAAIQMYEMRSGGHFAAGTALSTLVPRYLKTLPSNPTTGPVPATYNAQVVNAGGRTSLVLMELAGNAESVCFAIAAQQGMPAVPIANDVASVPRNANGCFKTSAAIGSTRASTYYAYTRTWGPDAGSTGSSGGSGGGTAFPCYTASNGTTTSTNCPGGNPPTQPVLTEPGCTTGPKGGCMMDCWYVEPDNPGIAVHGYCDADGVPIGRGSGGVAPSPDNDF